MKSTTNFRCEGCGGQVQYDIQSQQFLCTACRMVVEPELIQESVQEYDFSDYYQREKESSGEEEISSLRCSDCGNEIILDQHTIATVCPMCGSSHIKTTKGLTGIPPEGVIPFRVDRYEADKMFGQWVKKRWFAPNRLKEAYAEGGLEGIYLPYWTYDAVAVGNYSGEGGHTRTRKTSDGKTETYTQWYPVSGVVQSSFDDLLVCASEDEFRDLAQEVAPFNTIENTKPFAPNYLAGYQAKKYTIDGVKGFEEAKSVMNSHLQSEASSAIYAKGFDSARVHRVHSKFYDVTYKLVLLPIWRAAYSYNGKQYQYAINGESGKVTGQRPYSWIKIAFTIMAILLLVFGIVAASEAKEDNPLEALHNDNEAVVFEQREATLWHGLDRAEIQ